MPKERRWPAEEVVRKPIGWLKPADRNARKHSAEQIAEVAESIRSFGWTMPILADPRGKVIAGHARVEAAKSLGFAEVPVMIARHWSAAEKRAYLLADNQIAENADWDRDLLRIEIGELGDLGIDPGLLGFDSQFLDDLMNPASEGDGDGPAGSGSLAASFGVAPFSVLNARAGWWQDRKAAWVGLGIRSELGRGEGAENATPGGGPAADYSTRSRGDGRGRPIAGSEGKRVEKTTMVAGKGWAEGGPARRDPQFYAKKRAWEKENGRKISTTEFREQHWDGAGSEATTNG